jgi:hypothetical protein
MTNVPDYDIPDYMDRAHEIECGLHSGYPVCCVAFFVLVWHEWSELQRGSYMAGLKKSPGYVPCPRCLKAKTFVSGRPCACHALFELGRIFQHDVQTGELTPEPDNPKAFRRKSEP